MFGFVSRLSKRIPAKISSMLRLAAKMEPIADDMKILLATSILEIHRQRRSRNIQDYELKVFSQWGEDGIIQKLINSVDIVNRTFIEFGVEDFSELNCRFLMTYNNWSGFVIDGSRDRIRRLKSAYYFWRYELRALASFITRENINGLLAQSGLDHDLGILSVDLDGVDYYVLEAIAAYRPRILITEYNAVFGPTRAITVPYTADFYRRNAHHSDLYFGASLSALAYLAKKKGYTLVGTCSAGVNAFFVRSDLMTDALQALSPEEAYTASKFRESRDQAGNLSYLDGADRLKAIAGLAVVNVETGALEVI